jgi:hypothetical protein
MPRKAASGIGHATGALRMLTLSPKWRPQLPMPKFKFENIKFKAILEEYSQIRKVTIPDAVIFNARLLCVELSRRTQPFGNEQAKAVGEKAIVRDLLGRGMQRAGIFSVIGQAISNSYQEYATGNIRLFVRKDGTVYGTDRAHFMPDATESDMRAFHKRFFVGGKMSSAGSRTRDIGRWRFIEKMFVPQGAMDSYTQARLKTVGWAKAGWASCAKELRKVFTGSAVKGIPNFVRRHNSYNSDVIDQTSNAAEPSVTLINTTPYIDKILPITEQINALAVVKAKMKRQLETILKKRQKTLTE